MPNWFRGGKGPIIGLYVAHSGFQSGVSNAAAAHSILLADSVDLGEMIALSSHLSPAASPVDRSQLFSDMVGQELV